MSLDTKKNLIFNTFDGLEEQLHDPDPVKEVRNYRWALRQQTLLFQRFLNDLQNEKDLLEGEYDKKLADFKKTYEEELQALKDQLTGQEKSHLAEIDYQLGSSRKTLIGQEKALRGELEPRAKDFVLQIRDAVRLEETSLAEKHLRELFVLTKERAADLAELSQELKSYAKDLHTFGQDFNSYLSSTGAKLYTPKVGGKFDAGKHEIIQTVNDTTKDYNTIVEVHQPGYTIKKRTLIRAQVVVNANPTSSELNDDIQLSEKDVRLEVKELIDAFNSGADIKQIRKEQKNRKQEEFDRMSRIEELREAEEDMTQDNLEEEVLLTEQPLDDTEYVTMDNDYDVDLGEGEEPELTDRQLAKLRKREAKEAKRLAKQEAKEAKRLAKEEAREERRLATEQEQE